VAELQTFDDRVCVLGEDRATTSGRVWVDILGFRVLWRDLERTRAGPAALGEAGPREGRAERVLTYAVKLGDVAGSPVDRYAG
jgi:hypothetical protein